MVHRDLAVDHQKSLSQVDVTLLIKGDADFLVPPLLRGGTIAVAPTLVSSTQKTHPYSPVRNST